MSAFSWLCHSQKQLNRLLFYRKKKKTQVKLLHITRIFSSFLNPILNAIGFNLGNESPEAIGRFRQKKNLGISRKGRHHLSSSMVCLNMISIFLPMSTLYLSRNRHRKQCFLCDSDHPIYFHKLHEKGLQYQIPRLAIYSNYFS